MKTFRNLTIGVVIASLLAVAPLTASAASAHTATVESAAPSEGVPALKVRSAFIPEWYQFCYNLRPVGITVGKSGYINAYSGASGVSCKWWVMPWRAGFPHTVTKYYNWDTVCRYYGSTYTGMRNGYPWCR